jgi:hypothetical protein
MMEAIIALKMEGVCTSETSVYFNETTQRYTQKKAVCYLKSQRCNHVWSEDDTLL